MVEKDSVKARQSLRKLKGRISKESYMKKKEMVSRRKAIELEKKNKPIKIGINKLHKRLRTSNSLQGKVVHVYGMLIESGGYICKREKRGRNYCKDSMKILRFSNALQSDKKRESLYDTRGKDACFQFNVMGGNKLWLKDFNFSRNCK